MPDPEFAPTGLPRLMICGPVRAEEASPRFPLDRLPCYQALLSPAQATRSLPWLALPSATPPSATPPGAGIMSAATLSVRDGEALAEAMDGARWLLLVVNPHPDSLALAMAISADARGRDIEVIAFLPATPLGTEAEDALLATASATCHCPSTVSPLIAAHALWASVMCRGVVGADYADLRHHLTGHVRLHFAPQRQDGPERVRALLSQLDDIEGARTLWAVLVMPGDCALEEFMEIGDYLHSYCGDDTTVAIALPATEALPRGLYLFTC